MGGFPTPTFCQAGSAMAGPRKLTALRWSGALILLLVIITCTSKFYYTFPQDRTHQNQNTYKTEAEQCQHISQGLEKSLRIATQAIADLASSQVHVDHPRRNSSHKAEPLRVKDLEPDHEFVNSQKYRDYLEFVSARESIEAMTDHFDREGWISFKAEIPDKVLKGARAFTQRVYDTCILAKAGEAPEECRNLHQDKYTHEEHVRELALNYHIQAVLAVIHKHDPYPFQTLNYPCTSHARTHSDYIHFAAQPLPLMSAVWTALIDVHEDAGPVFYYPGSHKLASYNMQDFGLEERQKGVLNYAKYQDAMHATMQKLGFERKFAIMPAGHVFIWSANLVHGGPPANKHALPRLSQVTHYFYRNSHYNWAPVASDVGNGAIEYYDEQAVNKKWSQEGDPAELFALSKFRSGTCNMHGSISSPCDMHHRLPAIMSKLMPHVAEDVNDDVIM